MRAVDDNGDIVGAGSTTLDHGIHFFLLTPNSGGVPPLGEKRVDQTGVAPDGLAMAGQPAVAQPVATDESVPAPPAPVGAGEHVGVREPGVPRQKWWQWDEQDYF